MATTFWLSSPLQKEFSLWPHSLSSRSAAVCLTDVQPYRRSLDYDPSVQAGWRGHQHSLGSQRQILLEGHMNFSALDQRSDMVLGYPW